MMGQQAVLLVLMFAVGGVAGHQLARSSDAEAAVAQAEADTDEVVRQSEATIETVIKYVDRVRVIRESGETIIKEVPVYVESDACDWGAGLISVLDSAAEGMPVSGATEHTDATTGRIKAANAAKIVAENYAIYHQVAAQLASLQDWILKQSAPTSITGKSSQDLVFSSPK